LNLKNKTMEQILAFVLGAGAGLVIWGVVVAFKTAKLAKQNETSIRNVEEWISRDDEMVNRRIDQEIDRVNQLADKIYSAIDSRLDKLETKITKEKQILKG
jgi:ribosome-associated translation inhibitor RaiA